MILKLFLLCIVLLSLAFIGIGIKMFLIKGGQFKKKCAHIEFEDGSQVQCVCQSKTGRHEDCPHYQEHHGKQKLNLDYETKMIS